MTNRNRRKQKHINNSSKKRFNAHEKKEKYINIKYINKKTHQQKNTSTKNEIKKTLK